MPKVSVIVAVYNTQKYLNRCLDSIVNQSLKDIEIICVNDGSTDNSSKILNEYAHRDSRIKVINQENQGVSAARNIGIEHAKGEFIQFVDSDDFIEKRCLELAYEQITKKNTEILIYGSQDISNNKTKINYNYELLNYYVIANNSYTEPNNIKDLIHSVWDKLYRKSFLDKNKIRFVNKIQATEDGIFNLTCLYYGANFSVLNFIGYNRIDTKDSVTSYKKEILIKAINAIKYYIQSDIFKKSDNSLQIMGLNKVIGAVFYYYNQLETFSDKLFYHKNLENLQEYINQYINKSLSKKVQAYCGLRIFNHRKFILEQIFSIKNYTSENNTQKKITILGLKFRFKYSRYKKMQNKVQKYLVKKYIKPYLKENIETFNILQKQDFDTNKIIWQYWGQGIDENTPKIVKICFNSVNKYKDDYKQIILTNDNIREYIDLPDFVYEKLQNQQISHTFFSDILRTCLLSVYGGVWIDATILLTDKIPSEILNNKFFTFQRCKKSIYKKLFKDFNEYFDWSFDNKVNWLSSFIVSEKNYPLLNALKDIVLNYIKNENSVKFYYLIHLIFDYLVKQTKYKNFNCKIYDDTLPHYMQYNLNKEYSDSLWNKILSLISIHKLTYFKVPTINSIAQHILEMETIEGKNDV